MTRILFGTETELIIARSTPGAADGDLIAVEPVVLERLLWLAGSLYGVRETSVGRIQLLGGAVLYIDGSNLEYATPPCRGFNDVILYERDMTYMLQSITSAYKQKWGGDLTILLPGVGPGGELCGYHENYGLRRKDYFRLFSERNGEPTDIWLKVIIPFLVARIPMTGCGGLRDGQFCFSPRGLLTTHVFHQSTTSPIRPIVRLRRPQYADEFLRVELTCGDANRALLQMQIHICVTALVLLAAAQGIFEGLNLSLADPVTGMREMSRNIFCNLQLSDGGVLGGIEILRLLMDRLQPALPTLGKDIGDPGVSQFLDAFRQWREGG